MTVLGRYRLQPFPLAPRCFSLVAAVPSLDLIHTRSLDPLLYLLCSTGGRSTLAIDENTLNRFRDCAHQRQVSHLSLFHRVSRVVSVATARGCFSRTVALSGENN